MRKLAFFTLGMYISIIMSSFVFAASSVPVSKMCSIGSTTIDASTIESLEIWGTTPTTEEGYAKYEALYPGDDNANVEVCGKVNSNTGSYEMGDCANNQPPFLVTEILEPLGPEVDTSDSEIIDLYKGVCCIVGGTKSDGNFYCDQTRNIYTETYTKCTDTATSCQKVQWLLSTTGMGILKIYVKQIYVFGAGIVGFIAVATIVGSGIQISVSGATGDITAAKDRITQSIMGIALLFLSALILYTINPTFFY